RTRQERQQVFGELLASTRSGARQTRPLNARYWRQRGIADEGPRTVWSSLDTALVRGLRAGQPIFSPKLEGVFASRPADVIGVNPPRTDFRATVKNSIGDAVVCETHGPEVWIYLCVNRSTVDLEEGFPNLRADIVTFRRSNSIRAGPRQSEPRFIQN